MRRSDSQILDDWAEGVFALRASAGFVAAAGVVTAWLVESGPLSLQMLQHIAVMSVLAPIASTFLPVQPQVGSTAIWQAGLLQMVLLWAWHTPALQVAASQSLLAHSAAVLMLGICGMWFWHAVLSAFAEAGWRSLAALLFTGKIACLLGALLIFAPRDLYALPGLSLAWCRTGPSTLADQQLAGLLMVTACPLSYLVAGVILASGLLKRLDDPEEDRDVRPCAR